MANVSHASLTGAQLHEPKGASAAALGTVYVADGSGSGSWSNIGTSSFTGMIADFVAPLPPTGWLELDGSIISTTTYSSLYAVMVIPITGTRTNGSPIVTSIASTANLKAGYFFFGAGFATGTTILNVDSGTQVTLSNNASSSGTAAIAVSPWLLNTGTIKLPDLTTAGRFRRSRTSTTAVGQFQADQNQSHTHGVSGTSAVNSNDHSHTYSGNTGTESATHTHSEQGPFSFGNSGGGVGLLGSSQTNQTGTQSANHTHAYSGTTSGASGGHTHTFSTTSDATGSSEARPLSIIIMTCVKT